MIEIKIDEKRIKKTLDSLSHIEDGAPRAVSAALNRSIETARTEAIREVRKKYFVKAGNVRTSIKISKASAVDLRAKIRSKGSPMSLSKFRITPNRNPGKKGTTPVRARVMKSSSNKAIPGAFVVKLASGHKGVFIRAGKGRTPINEKFGPSIPQMIGNKEIAKWIEERTLERFDERLDHEIGRVLRGAGK